MVRYVHDSTTLWTRWDPAFQVVRSQSNVIFDEEKNTHALCLLGDDTDIFKLPGDGLLQTQDNETGGDGHLHDQAENSRTGEGHGSLDDDSTDDDTDHNLPDADNC
jgi:hypothetical protein